MGAQDEFHSLEELCIFVLILCSELPKGKQPLKGKLICNVSMTTLERSSATKCIMWPKALPSERALIITKQLC